MSTGFFTMLLFVTGSSHVYCIDDLKVFPKSHRTMRRTIAGHPSFDKQKKIAEETLQFFVPMAKSLGLMPMAEELKKRCLVVLNRK